MNPADKKETEIEIPEVAKKAEAPEIVVPEPEAKQPYKPSFVDKAKISSGDADAAKAAAANDFRTENIGRWKAKQENVFAAQNRKAAEEKAERTEKWKKARPFVFIGGGLVAAGLVAWGIVALVISLQPEQREVHEIAGGTVQDMYNYQDVLQKVYDENGGDIDAVNQAVDDVLKTENGKQNESAIRVARLNFLLVEGLYEDIIAEEGAINPDELNNDQKLLFYNSMYFAYVELGEDDVAERYAEKRYDVLAEMEREEQERNEE